MKSSVIVNTAFEEKERNAMGYLISETTKEEREKIVAESLGNIDAACDAACPDSWKCIRITSTGN